MNTNIAKHSENTADNRARLLNMTAGGDGHIHDWIERVTLDDAPEDMQTAYVYHSPAKRYDNGNYGTAKEFLGTEEHARKFYALGREDIADIYAIPVEDIGRHIPADVWQNRYEAMIITDN